MNELNELSQKEHFIKTFLKTKAIFENINSYKEHIAVIYLSGFSQQ